jgi:hypothetical protein
MEYPPEPFASSVDVLQAATEVENAIHASNSGQAVNALDRAISWLSHAKAYFELGISEGKTNYQPFLQLADAAITDLDGIKQHVSSLSGTALTTYQNETIYDYQAYLGYLYAKLLKLVMTTY